VLKYKVPIRFKWAFIINLLVVPLLLLLSLLFYWQFRNALDQRVLLQLSSIKQLKSVQIEDYLQQEWNLFNEVINVFKEENRTDLLTESAIILLERQDLNSGDTIVAHLLSLDVEGLHDLSAFSPAGEILIGCYIQIDSLRRAVRISQAEKIQQILLERTGMGETGETYLVGPDFRLRSASRFFPGRKPYDIAAQTEGVNQAFQGSEGTDFFPDYRGVDVFSSYGPLRVDRIEWAILSEIDKQEAHQPLIDMQNRLLLILCLVIILTIFGSFFLARSLVKPLGDMKDRLGEMALGNFSMKSLPSYREDEIGGMFKALDQLVVSISQAMNFAKEIGAMHLEAEYEILSEHDSLGRSLIHMREKLRDLKQQEEQLQLSTQKAILHGQEKERARLSREMHDGLGPLLTALKMMVQQLPISWDAKDKIKNLLDETIAEVRRMTYNLMPQALVDFGVGEALANLAKMSAKASGISIKYINSINKDSRLPDIVNIGLYRIAQEALNNALKHSGATEIRMSLTGFDDRISFYFNDNGTGFDALAKYSGSGLLNIKERCRILHGIMNLTSDENGTTLEIEIPLKND
jgi:signal transduction histidine kinase